MDWKRKLTSRKFWLTVGEFVAMLVVALGGTEDSAAKITALIIGGGAVIAYIVGEGLIDAAGAGAPTISFDPELLEGELQPPINGEENETNG